MIREHRDAESDLVERIIQVTDLGDIHGVTTPDGTWDFVFRRRRGELQVLQTGQIDRPIELDYEREDSYLAVVFKPDVFMPHQPGRVMANRGLLRRDPIVRRAVDDCFAIRDDDRTTQRRFAHVTGMTCKALQQILRANEAQELLVRGGAIAAVATELGYTDQAHLTNSVRRILGRTPGDIAREARLR